MALGDVKQRPDCESTDLAVPRLGGGQVGGAFIDVCDPVATGGICRR